MDRFDRILVTVDGSRLALAAIPHAAELAKQLDAEVLVLEVVRSPRDDLRAIMPAAYELTGRVDPFSFAAAVLAERQAAEEHLDEAEALLREHGVISVKKWIAAGPVASTILAVALQTESDLIVMATHGRSGLERAMIGSVADEVVRRSVVAPVLLVHPTDVVEDGEVRERRPEEQPEEPEGERLA